MLMQKKYLKINNRHVNKHRMKIIIFIFSLTIGSFTPINIFAQQPNLYRNKEHAFRIIFPEGWLIAGNPKPSNPDMPVRAHNGYGESINVVIKKKQSATFNNLSPSETKTILDSVFNEIKKAMPQSVLRQTAESFFCNNRALWLVYDFTYNNYKGRVLQVMIPIKGKVFIISAGSSQSRYQQFEPLFMQTISSIYFYDDPC